MNILALETSGNSCSVAVSAGDDVIIKQAILPQQHGQVLLDWIAAVLSEAKLTISSLNALSYSCGPGGFTGIRMSAAVLQGLALARDLTILAVPTLQVIAQGIHRIFGASKIVVIEDARMQQVFCGLYQIDNEMMMAVRPDEILNVQQLNTTNLNEESAWLASNALTIPEVHQFVNRHSFIKVISSYSPSALDVLFLASQFYKQGVRTKADEALPLYLRLEDAWRKQS